MPYVLAIIAVLFVLGCVLMSFWQKKHVSDMAQQKLEREVSYARRKLHLLKHRLEASKETVENLECRVAERNKEIRLLREELMLQERQDRMARVVGW